VLKTWCFIGIKTVVNSLLLSIPSLMNVLLIILLFLLVFGILGVQMFKGAVSYCNDDSDAIQNRAECVGTYLVPVIDEFGHQVGNLTLDREWMTPINNYDNIFNSMMTFFEICSLEMWPDRMFEAIDSRGVDIVP
jgi:voltage-dependent calcium channel T type alpha-1G